MYGVRVSTHTHIHTHTLKLTTSIIHAQAYALMGCIPIGSQFVDCNWRSVNFYLFQTPRELAYAMGAGSSSGEVR